MTLVERALQPSPALRPYVSRIRVLAAHAREEAVWLRAPDASSALVVCRDWAGDTRLLAVGPNPRATYQATVATPLYIRAELRPGAARALLGVPPREIEGRAVPLDELWGGREVGPGRALLDEGGVDTALASLEAMVLSRVDGGASPLPTRVRLLGAAAGLTAADDEQAPGGVARLARRASISERQLRRLFHDEIGVSPKRYARIARLRRVLARIGAWGWARTAAEHGFSDQSHLIAEFRALLGVTPGAFVDRGLARAPRCGAAAG